MEKLMAKILCEKCGSEKITIISQLIEQKNNDNKSLFLVSYLACLVGIIVGVVTMFNTTIYIQISPITLLIGSFVLLLLTGFFQAIQPIKYLSKTKCICLECGNTWYLDDGEKQEKKKKGFFSI